MGIETRALVAPLALSHDQLEAWAKAVSKFLA